MMPALVKLNRAMHFYRCGVKYIADICDSFWVYINLNLFTMGMSFETVLIHDY